MAFFSRDRSNNEIGAKRLETPIDREALLAEQRRRECEYTDATAELEGIREDIEALQTEILEVETELAALLKPLEGQPLFRQLLQMINNTSLLRQTWEASELISELRNEMEEEEQHLQALDAEIREHHRALLHIIAILKTLSE